jgi:hypothetical protein
VKWVLSKPRIKHRLAMSLRRESPIRGRRLRLDEALLERFAMSPAGYQSASDERAVEDERPAPSEAVVIDWNARWQLHRA